MCKKHFNEKRHFQGHMRSHVEHKSYTCSSCPQAFQYRTGLLRHMKICGQSKSKTTHICETCGANFSRKDILNDHKKCKHNKQRTYNCSFCGAKYLWRQVYPNTLIPNIRMHCSKILVNSEMKCRNWFSCFFFDWDPRSCRYIYILIIRTGLSQGKSSHFISFIFLIR